MEVFGHRGFATPITCATVLMIVQATKYMKSEKAFSLFPAKSTSRHSPVTWVYPLTFAHVDHALVLFFSQILGELVRRDFGVNGEYFLKSCFACST